MNRIIPDGAWCLFRHAPKGSLHGRILVVGRHVRTDVTGGGAYTVKRYSRLKSEREGEGAASVTLLPESYDPTFEPIALNAADADELMVVAEFIQVLQ